MEKLFEKIWNDTDERQAITMNGISEEKYTHIDEIKEQTKAVFDELMEQAKIGRGRYLSSWMLFK